MRHLVVIWLDLAAIWRDLAGFPHVSGEAHAQLAVLRENEPARHLVRGRGRGYGLGVRVRVRMSQRGTCGGSQDIVFHTPRPGPLA